MSRDSQFVVTSVRVEKWKLEAAKRAGINISEVVRRALDLALAARSKSVSVREVLENEKAVAALKEEYEQELAEAEMEEERRKRAAELQKRMRDEEERRKKRSEKVQAERLKAWLRRRPAVVAEMM